MMQLWLTRYLKPVSLTPSLAASVVVHAAIIWSAVTVTGRPRGPEGPPPDNAIVRFLAPPNRTAAQTMQREMVRYVALGTPVGEIASEPRVGMTKSEPPPVSGLDPLDAPALEELAGLDSVFSLIEVDSAASRYEWSAAPAFPPSMLARRQGGFVRAEWVVDETGVADTTTLRIVEATHPEFVKAVRDALPFMRFRPARIGDRPVRQLVQQPFFFQITTAAADTGATKKPLL
jgi:hypothetical protein